MVFLLSIGAGGLGCLLILHAGSREKRGRLEAARRIVRRGGFVLAAGAVTGALSMAWLGWNSAGGMPRPLPLAIGVAALLASGFTGLLAGLSGKPRPSGFVAAVLWMLGLLFYLTGC